MPIRIMKEDLTKVRADALVNATDSHYSGGGGLDRAVHAAAGPEMDAFLVSLPPLRPGECTVSPAFGLKAKVVIHTVAPVWHGGDRDEEAVLHACYRGVFETARKCGCSSVAVPLLGAGHFGCPEDTVYRIACEESRCFSDEYDMDISILIFPGAARSIAGAERAELDGILSHGYAENRRNTEREGAVKADPAVFSDVLPDICDEYIPRSTRGVRSTGSGTGTGLLRRIRDRESIQAEEVCYEAPPLKRSVNAPDRSGDLEEELKKELKRKHADGFTQTLLSMIDARGMKDPECYHRANIDRKLFSKIRSDPAYRPAKKTVLAFAVALRLNMDETEALLRSAGFALNGSVTDTVVAFYITHGCYDIDRINITLYSYDQEILGARTA